MSRARCALDLARSKVIRLALSFFGGFHLAVDRWNATLQTREGYDYQIIATNPLNQQPAGLSVTRFADDVGRKYILDSAENLIDVVKLRDLQFNAELASI